MTQAASEQRRAVPDHVALFFFFTDRIMSEFKV